MNMTDYDKRLLIRGMSIASGLLINAQCPHRGVITAYQKTLAEAWGIDDRDVAHRAEFMPMVEELNQAIAAQDPSAINPSDAGKSRKDN
jgi:hypothetical protein